MASYWDSRIYSGRGVTVEVEPYVPVGKRITHWRFRFPPSNLWFHGHKNKLRALVWAAWKCKRSCQAMNFTPIKK